MTKLPTYLTDVHDIFAKDMKDPKFAEDVRKEMDSLAKEVAAKNEKHVIAHKRD